VKSFPLAILLVFRNQKEIAEKTLTNIYSKLNPDFELYVVDDASEDDTRQTIQSVVEHYAHESTYFFENATSLGRDKCLQELLQQVSTPFVWMPEDIDESFVQFQEVQSLLKSSPTTPSASNLNSTDETDASGEKLRPDSLAAVWLATDEEIKQLEEVPTSESKVPDETVIDKKVTPEPARPQKMPIKMKSMYRMHSLVLPENASDAAKEVFPRMDEYVQEGEYLYALKLVDAEQIKHPLDADLIRLKIKVLELMRRYVEAAELKHQLKLGGPGVARPKIRRESILIVDPTEDYEGTALIDPQEKTGDQNHERNDKKVPLESPSVSPKLDDFHSDLDFDDFDSGVIGVPRPMSVSKSEPTTVKPPEDIPGESDDEVIYESEEISENSEEFEEEAVSDFEDLNKTQFEYNPETDSADAKEREGYPEPKVEARSELEPDSVTEFVSESEIKSEMDFAPEESRLDPEEKVSEPEFAPKSEESFVSDETESSGSGEYVFDDTDESDEDETHEINDTDETLSQNSVDGVSGADDGVASDEDNKTQLEEPAFMQPVNPGERPINKTVFDGKYNGSPRISIIIPTTIDGKALLERTVFSLSKFGDGVDRELIIIDNASLDDTYDYLKQLKKENFMQVRIITNHENVGFAKSINQGVEIAKGQYIMVLHNDVVIRDDIPGKLADLMDENDEITVLGPTTQVTMCDAQRTKTPDNNEKKIKKTRFIDSFCMMLRKGRAGKFDEQFGLAYFDDMDYCLQDVKNGGMIAVAVGLSVDHLGGATTSAIGMESFSRAYWKNASLFESKWDLLPSLPEFPKDESPIKKLVAISDIINPYYPEAYLFSAIIKLMTSEVRNEIIETKHSQQQLSSLIRLMMIIDMRDVLRILEDRLIENEYDPHLIYQLIDFYYQKNIYSRCQKYLAKINPTYKSFGFGLLELRVLMGTRDIAKAVELLSRLINEVPTHPELFKITADIHRIQGNKSEADEFYSLAYQTDPYTNRKV
jgi:GT2 family glycosyltransferase